MLSALLLAIEKPLRLFCFAQGSVCAHGRLWTFPNDEACGAPLVVQKPVATRSAPPQRAPSVPCCLASSATGRMCGAGNVRCFAPQNMQHTDIRGVLVFVRVRSTGRGVGAPGRRRIFRGVAASLRYFCFADWRRFMLPIGVTFVLPFFAA